MDFYGTSECFLFQLFPYVKFYHHTNECSNTNFMLSDPTGLYVGGYSDFPGGSSSIKALILNINTSWSPRTPYRVRYASWLQ